MPKKKLTKTQLNQQFKKIVDATQVLFLDKLGHRTNSLVPMSLNKLLELSKIIDQATARIK